MGIPRSMDLMDDPSGLAETLTLGSRVLDPGPMDESHAFWHAVPCGTPQGLWPRRVIWWSGRHSRSIGPVVTVVGSHILRMRSPPRHTLPHGLPSGVEVTCTNGAQPRA